MKTKIYIWSQFTRLHWQGGGATVARRWLWEGLQTFIGYGVGCLTILFFSVRRIEAAHGAVVLEVDTGTPYWGGICFGTVILGDRRISAATNNHLFMHEFGHSLQSRLSGPLYLFKYGLPSVFSARTKGRHAHHPVEQDANRRAQIYFSAQPDFRQWPEEQNPILRESALLPLRWWEYVPGIYPLFHIFTAWGFPRR